MPAYREPERSLMAHSPISVDVGSVAAYIINPRADGWRVLMLQRAPHTIRPGSWEIVTGTINDGERPEDAARREVREETGFTIDRLYGVEVQPFYLVQRSSIQLMAVFAAFVDNPPAVVLNEEHERFEWLDVSTAIARATWPRTQRTIADIVHLLGPENIGRVEDVLRVR